METVRTILLDGLVLEASITKYDDFTVINKATLLMNLSDEVVFDLSIFDNQETVRKALAKKCYLPIYEWEMQDYLAGEEA
ncbi:hypothetical protein [Moraxella bovoculi]|uniref:hypothetical protein n=1 Tax=Moraxella bovoculi TaxID=386891 RepID=UPI0012D42FB4|nr:hypothetical protein [Moraxella bovoculi]